MTERLCTAPAPSSRCRSQVEASSSLPWLWSPCWWSTCSSTLTGRTRCSWCSLLSRPAPCSPCPAPQIYRSPRPSLLGWTPGPHNEPAGSVPVTMPVFAGRSLQRRSCLCTCWWSGTSPHIVAAALWSSKSSKAGTDQKMPWCARRGWLGGLSPGEWSWGPDVDPPSGCVGPPPQGPSQFLWLYVLLIDTTRRPGWGWGPRTS